VDLNAFFGDRPLRSPLIDVVGDAVVLAANVTAWGSATIVVGKVDADGAVTRAP
jgi:hypothetical protein